MADHRIDVERGSTGTVVSDEHGNQDTHGQHGQNFVWCTKGSHLEIRFRNGTHPFTSDSGLTVTNPHPGTSACGAESLVKADARGDYPYGVTLTDHQAVYEMDPKVIIDTSGSRLAGMLILVVVVISLGIYGVKTLLRRRNAQ